MRKAVTAVLLSALAIAVTAGLPEGQRPKVPLLSTKTGAQLVLGGKPATAPTLREGQKVVVSPFKSLAWAEKAELLQQAGVQAPAEPPADEGFTVTPRFPWVDGKGYISTENGVLDPNYNSVMANSYQLEPQGVTVQATTSWLRSHSKLLIHFNVVGSGSKSFNIYNFVDGTLSDVPGKGTSQDIVVFVDVPAASLTGDKLPLVRVSMVTKTYWEFRGVQVSPVP